MKSHTKLLVSILLITAIANTTGCSKNKESENNELKINSIIEDSIDKDFSYIENNDGLIIDNSPNEVIKDVLDEENSEKAIVTISSDICTTEIDNNQDVLNIEDVLKTNLYDENIDYNLIIDVYLNNYDLREEFRNEYLKAIYMLLINSNVKMSDYLEELHTMVVMQQIPMCVPEEVWNEQFKNLIALDPNCISLFDKYSEFAIYVHSLECNKEHTYNEFYCYTCEDLEEEYTRKLTIDN